jgi:DHA1 family tetracycline resistance protein-like MFS transporter
MSLFPRFEHRAVPIALAAVTIDVIGFGIVMPVLPTLITRLAHVDLASATRISGWMLAVFAVMQFFAGPVLGNLGDRFGRRPVLIAAMVAFAVDYALMAVAPTIGWLFLGRAIAGITGATFGPIGAVIADVTPPERRATNFGYMSAAFGIGFIIGPALGGLVAAFGPRAPFWLASGLALANAVTMYFLLPETLDAKNRRPFALRDAHVIGAFKPLFAAGNASPLLVAWFLWQLGGIVYPTTWAFWAKLRFEWSDTQIGWSLAWVGFLQLLVQIFLTERVFRWIGERGAAIAGLGCGAVTLIVYAFITQGWQVYAFFLVGCLGALAWPALNGILSRMVDATRQGALQGGIGSMNSVSAVLGPLIAAQSLAWGARHSFDGAAFLVAGLLIGAAALIVLLGTPARAPETALQAEA